MASKSQTNLSCQKEPFLAHIRNFQGPGRSCQDCGTPSALCLTVPQLLLFRVLLRGLETVAALMIVYKHEGRIWR